MSIYRRGNTWWYTFMVKGVVHRGSCKTSEEAQAREYHDRKKAEAWRSRVMRDAKRHTFDEAVKRFLKERENKRSYRDDQRYAEWWLDEFKSAQVVMLEDVVPDVVAEIRDEAMTRKTPRGNLTKPATMNRRLAFLRSVLYTAHKEWMWLDQCPKIKLLSGETERFRFLQPEEVIRLVEALPEPYGDMALFAVSTGLRQSNVLGLRWDWVNMQRKSARFPNEVMKNGQPFTCALNETAVMVLRRYLGKDTERVFIKPDGQPVSSIPSKTWKAALKKAGLEDVRWHDLRHTWASLLRQSGVELSELQEMGGWESATMVQRYAHLNVEHLVSHAQKMDGLLSRGATVQKLHSVA